MSFAHLHLHTHYSNLDSTIDIDSLVKYCLKEGVKSVAITDHGNLNAFPEAYKKFKENNLNLIVGSEVYISQTPLAITHMEKERPYHGVLLCLNNEGFRNLKTLLLESYLGRVYKVNRVSLEDLKKHNSGLIMLSGCIQGELAQAVLNKGIEAGVEVAKKYKDIFGDNFIIELQYHYQKDDIFLINNLIQIARKLSLPVVITNDVHYLLPEDENMHRILCFAKNYSNKSNFKYIYENGEYFFKTEEEMFKTFKKLIDDRAIDLTEKELRTMINNTGKIAEACKVDIEQNVFYFPKTEEKSLAEICKKSLQHLAIRDPEVGKNFQKYKERLEKELGIVKEVSEKTGIDFELFFLITKNIVDKARDSQILIGPGRGSAVGSLMVYLLGITEVDPIKYGLSFERFLNPSRISMPDIDIDIEHQKRRELVEHLIMEHGAYNIGGIINYTSFGLMAYKDIARYYNIDFNDVNKYTKTMEVEDQLPEEFYREQNLMDKRGEIEVIASKMKKLIRSTSRHASGYIVCSKPLQEVIPVIYDNDEKLLVSTADKDVAEFYGLLKIDLLASKTLTLLKEVAEKTRETNFQFEKDQVLVEKTMEEIFCKGKTAGVFQFESGMMREFLIKSQPRTLLDLSVISALGRPGPKEFIEIYIEKKKKQDRSAISPSLRPAEEVLKETYGIVVYQEQVMEIAKKVCGFSDSKADEIRKIISKKKAEEFEKIKAEWIEGAKKTSNLSEEEAQRMLQDLQSFTEYAFNKSHAVAYALVSLRNAILKYKHPGYFYASLLDIYKGSTTDLCEYIKALYKEGIFDGTLQKPDVRRLNKEFIYDPQINSIISPITAIKQVGTKALEALEKKIEPDFSIDHLIKLKQKEYIKTIVRAGGFDNLIMEKTGAKTFREILQGRELVLKEGVDFSQKTGFYLFLKELANQWKSYGHCLYMSSNKKHMKNFYEVDVENYRLHTSHFVNEQKEKNFEEIKENENFILYGVIKKIYPQKVDQGFSYTLVIVDNFGEYNLKYRIFSEGLSFSKKDLENLIGKPFAASVSYKKDGEKKYYKFNGHLKIKDDILSNIHEIIEKGIEEQDKKNETSAVNKNNFGIK